MIFIRPCTFIVLLTGISTAAQLPEVSRGNLQRHENFSSRYVSPRHVEVWLPVSYNPRKKYSVLYMHDGQMLFDSATTWNKKAWDADDVITGLLQQKMIKDVIVVGVWNSGATRHSDYFPQKIVEGLTPPEKERIFKATRSNGEAVFNVQKINSDNYLRFLVSELKPFIDKTYSTRRRRKYTMVAGSSMGGLISIYAICEYPKVFGGAACLSTHWPGIFSMDNNPVPGAFFRYLQLHLPTPANHRIYFDHGTATLDTLYPPLQKKWMKS
jgi:predicted alpha/beta superfamily hydrolase